MDENKLKFGVGVLVIATIGIGIILTFLFGAFPAVLAREYDLTVWFPSAEGINTNSPVYRDGVKIGRVEQIELQDGGGVHLRLSLDQQYPMTHVYVPQIGLGSLITGDSKLEFVRAERALLNRIYATNEDLIDQPYTDDELFKFGQKMADPFSVLFGMEDELRSTFGSVRGAGDAIQDIAGSINGLVGDVRSFIGSPENGVPQARRRHRSPIQLAAFQTPGGRLPGETPPGGGLGGLPRGQRVEPLPPPAAAPATPQTLRELIPEAIQTLEEFQLAVRDVRGILNDQQLRADIAETTKRIPILLDDASETLRSTTETFDTFRDVGDQFEQVGVVAEDAVKTAQETIASFQSTAENIEAFTEPLGDQGGVLVEQALKSLANLDNVLLQAETFTTALNSGDGTLRRLIEEPELYDRINRTVENIEAATVRIRPILDDVRVFSDKIARDPRQLGVRGAVGGRSTGLGLK